MTIATTLAALIVSLAMQAVPPAPFQTISRDMTSQVDRPRQTVARTPAEWLALWKLHGSGDAPKVDFATHTVVAVFLGSRPTGGYSVEFVRAHEEKGVLVVQWRERRPDPGDMTAQILTSPMHAATIPKFAGEIRIDKVEK